MTRSFIHILAISLFLSAGSSAPTFAWEEDVHFGLTRWLAVQAGLSEHEADQVGLHDLERDQKSSSAIYSTLWYVCLRGLPFLSPDGAAAQRTLDYHFPSAGRIGELPNERRVVPNSGDATRFIPLRNPG